MRKISGVLSLVGEQRGGYNLPRYELVRVGDVDLRGLRMHALFESVLEIGEKVDFSVHRVESFARYVLLSVRIEGRHYRFPFFEYLVSVIGWGVLWAFLSYPLVGIAGIVTVFRDLRAWSRS